MGLIEAMLDGKAHGVPYLTEVLGTSRRNLYYVLQSLDEVGFRVIHEGHTYALDPRSPLLRRLADAVTLSHDEAMTVAALLARAAMDSPEMSLLHRKFVRFYKLDDDADAALRRRTLENVARLELALEGQRVVILHDYSSPHSGTVSDRMIEPFCFLGGREDIRGYELRSKTNKTFKLSRIGGVEVIDTPWFHADRHREVFTDLFMFSGEERHPVRLRLGRLAHHLMLEEYPLSAEVMRQEDDDHWLLSADVASYLGIGRFVLGLYEDIEVLGDAAFQAYLSRKIADMARRSTPAAT